MSVANTSLYSNLAVLGLCVLCLLLRLWLERSRITAALRRVCRCWAALHPRLLGDSSFEQRVREECTKKRVERAREAVLMMNIWSIFRLAYGSKNLGFYVFAVFGAVVSACPKALTSKTLDAIYVLGMLLLSSGDMANALGYTQFDDWFSTEDCIQRPVVLFGMCVLNPRVWLNALLAMIWSICVAHGSGDDDRPYSLFSAGGGTALFTFLMWLNHITERAVRLELSALDSSSQVWATRSLLDKICDVTVDMDCDLRIAKHSSQLAHLLFRGPQSSLVGRKMQEFMPEHDDRDRFEKYVQGMGQASEDAAVFHTKLRDGVSGTIDMEFFSVAFNGIDNRRSYVIGMREFTDIQPMKGLPRQGEATRAPKPCRPMINGPGTPASVEHCDLQSNASSSSSSSGSFSASVPFSTSQVAAEDTRIQTHYEVRRQTMLLLLGTWHVPRLSSDCCSWHAYLNAAGTVLINLGQSGCSDGETSEKNWQCKRCGIQDEEFRRTRGPRRCYFCKDISDDVLIQPEPVQTSVRMAL